MKEEGPDPDLAAKVLEEDTRHHLTRALKAIEANYPAVTEPVQDFIRGAMFAVLIEQQLRLQKRTQRALRLYPLEPGGLFNVFLFSSSAGRWEAAQRIKQLRRELREARKPLTPDVD